MFIAFYCCEAMYGHFFGHALVQYVFFFVDWTTRMLLYHIYFKNLSQVVSYQAGWLASGGWI